MEISLEEIENVEDGEIFIKDHLLVFGKNLETVLKEKITGWDEILSLIRETFNLPSDSSKPGPRDIHALGLIYAGEYKENEKLNTKIENARPKLDEIKQILNNFINQNIEKPDLLKPDQNG
jgi:hypothetical protein